MKIIKSRSNLVLLGNLQTLTAARLVGQEVKVTVDSLEIGNDAIKGQFNLAHAAGSVEVKLTDVSGKTTSIPLGSQAPGLVPMNINPTALGLSPGKYTVDITSDSGEYGAGGSRSNLIHRSAGACAQKMDQRAIARADLEGLNTILNESGE